MIAPTKHMNLDLSVLQISALVMNHLRKRRIVTFDEALNKVMSKAGKDASLVFTDALSFVFLLGKVEYHIQTDSLEYVDS